jgi:hypothetical protein
VRSLPARPATAAGALQSSLSKLQITRQDATTYGAEYGLQSSLSKRPVQRIGNHVFCMDPQHNPYYNCTEHGTYLLREAISQKNGKRPAWA